MPTIRFWKPYEVLTKFTDADNRPTLADYINIPDIYAAGRLDYQSEGLLLLTDDGALNAQLTQPKYEHPRTYWVQVEHIPSEESLEKLRHGIAIKGGITRPAQAKLLESPPQLPERPTPIRYRANIPTTWLEMTLTEGRNRQVRRMTASIGHPTLRLIRVAIGDITLAGLTPGTYDELTPQQINQLKKQIKHL